MNVPAFIPYDVAAWRTAFFALAAEEQNEEIPTRGFDTQFGPYETAFESKTKTTEN